MDMLERISLRSEGLREKIEKERSIATELLKRCFDKKMEIADVIEASCKGDLQATTLNKKIESLKVSCREAREKLENHEIKTNNDWSNYRARSNELHVSHERNMKDLGGEERLHWQKKANKEAEKLSLTHTRLLAFDAKMIEYREWLEKEEKDLVSKKAEFQTMQEMKSRFPLAKAERDGAYSELRSLLEKIFPSSEPREASKAVELAEKLKNEVEELKMALEAEKSGRRNDQQEYESMLAIYRKLPVSQHLQVSRELLLESAQAHLSTSEDKQLKITHEQPHSALSFPLKNQVSSKRTHLDDEIANLGNPEILETRTRKRPPVDYNLQRIWNWQTKNQG
ncbi:hypothetical protein HYFRA_00004509 [Hymenoscyphus fraxineus]|uniref:Uncharacterized protein n=1 Tax=Hymenoscyphus fraxineus TaxID=746836 RepID=A0A9N9PUJ8_9HELO|nr:hypothetical protein HYFRA_00004509 [Hymenoscyphus fraxineus]